MEFMDELTRYFCWTGKWEREDFIWKKKIKVFFFRRFPKNSTLQHVQPPQGQGVGSLNQAQ